MKKVYLAVLIIVITFAAFLPSLQNGFTNWDDDDYIAKNPIIRNFDFKNTAAMFTEFNAGNYHPLVFLSFAVEYRFFKLNPLPYHLDNLLFHIINSLLVFWLVLLILQKKYAAFAAALLFGIHPLHVESVAWVTERKDTLSAIFFFASLIAYIFYSDKSEKKLKLKYALSLAFFIFALLSKPMAITLPVILILCDYLFNRKFTKATLLEKAPFFILSFVFGIVTIFAQDSAGSISKEASLSIFNRLFIASHGLAFYIVKSILPFKLSAFYPYPTGAKTGVLPSLFYISIIFPVLLSSVLYFAFRKNRLIFFCIAFYLITLIPVIQLIQIGNAAAADRYFYIPSIGVFILFCYLGDILFSKHKKTKGFRIIFISSISLIIIFFASLSFFRCMIWKNSFTLWNDVIAKNADVPMAYYGRGTAYLENGITDKALADFNKALELDNVFPDAYINRGNIFSALGESKKAIDDFSKAVSIEPKIREPYLNRGNEYAKTGENKKAVEDYTKTLELYPAHPNARLYRARALKNLKEFKKAKKDLEDVIAENPNRVEAQINLAEVYLSENNPDKAMGILNYAEKLNGKSASIYYNKATAFILMKKYNDAMVNLNRALEINPKYPEVFLNRGNLFMIERKYEEAIADYSSAIEISGKYVDALMNRANAYLRINANDKAIEDLGTLLSIEPYNVEALNARAALNLISGDRDAVVEDVKKLRKMNLKFNPELEKAVNVYNEMQKMGEDKNNEK